MIIRADARHIPLADGIAQCVVTSPPYWGLRDYRVVGQIGLEPTLEAYVTTMVLVFREVRRVLRDDGTVWCNLGDSYAGAGYSNHYNTRGAQREDGGKQRHNYPRGFKLKDLIGVPWRVAFALQADGWYLRSDIIWAKPNPMPESVADRPTRSHEYLFLLTKSARYYYNADAIREPLAAPECTIRSTQNWQGNGELAKSSRFGNGDQSGRNKRDVWTVNSESTSESHFATFPQKLIEPCILAGSRIGDLVLDPFLGSGTVGRVCERLGRKSVGLELSEQYITIARKHTSQMGLFA